MDDHDLTTPLDELPEHDQPTANRDVTPRPRGTGGFAPGAIVATRYRIVALLGRGGMGEVYRADDLRLGQPVALKFVDVGSDAQSLEHLYHEVRVARQVSHPNVCRVHDVVEAGGLRFIAMEYVDGEDLASLLRRIGRLPAAKATDVSREIAAGLAAAHDRGVVHRDLKPANVMIDGNGHAHVTDFGLAALAGIDDGRIAGTPAYMAPEQVAGEPVTTRSDVYALGLLMYELFTGERVYASSSFADRRKQRAVTPRRASSSVKDVDPAIDALIAECLAEDPSKRPASARAVLAQLPGGDAIDVAMAAGETPSPEMVAAAAETGELPARVAIAVVAAIAVLVGVIAWQTQSYLFTLMRKPPEVFMDRATSIVVLAGEKSAAGDEVHFYDYDSELLHELGKRTRAEIAATRPGIMHFVYRRSPQRMAPRETIEEANDFFIFQSGHVTLTDPKLSVPGEAIVILDHHEALIEYRALPSGHAPKPDWRPLLEATGVDMTTLVETQPALFPVVATDSRVAWTGTFAGNADRVRIEAASLNGMPAWLKVAGPWQDKTKPVTEMATRQIVSANAVASFVQMWIGIIFLIVAVVTTRRILRRGRSDTTSAARLSLYYGGCLFVSWLIAAHHALDARDEAPMFVSGLGAALAGAASLWFLYIALEPAVRRTWPRALVGWMRLLAGRFRDPLVARQILFGILGGAAATEAVWLALQARAAMRGATHHFVRVAAIEPLATYVGDALIDHAVSISLGIGTIFICVCVRLGLGRIGAAVVFVLLLAGFGYVSPASAIFGAIQITLMFRIGLLSAVTTGAVVNLLSDSPLTFDTGAWYWPRAVASLLIVALATAWAARTATMRSR